MATTAEDLAGLFERFGSTGLPVRLRMWDGSEAGPAGAPCLIVHSRRALRRVLWAPGELGLARAYVCGDIDVEGDLLDGLRRCWDMAGNQQLGGARPPAVSLARIAVRHGLVGPPPRRPPEEARLAGRLHSAGRDRAAISHHYDLSNHFYETILDPTMSYSCGYWADADSLADAQQHKLELICRKLKLSHGMRLLDVGCGWGSLVLHAAAHHGVYATGITLSHAQAEHVHRLIKEAELADRVTVEVADYRDFVAEPFDAIGSIEMAEHVGTEQFPIYLGTLNRLLRKDGRLLLQLMSRTEVAPGGGPFIERYIAPDMHMRPVEATLAELRRVGFAVHDVQSLRADYARTAAAWAVNLQARWDTVIGVVGIRQARIWQLYLAGGQLAFEQGRMGVDQILATHIGSQ